MAIIFGESLSLDQQHELVNACRDACDASPLEVPVTPIFGVPYSVSVTNMGVTGWVSDRNGVRQDLLAPNGLPWPPIPDALRELAQHHGLEPGTCRLILFDEGEGDWPLRQESNLTKGSRSPIVIVALGATAVYQLGGHKRTDEIVRHHLDSGSVLVLTRGARRCYIGIEGVVPWSGPPGLLKDRNTHITLMMYDSPAASLSGLLPL